MHAGMEASYQLGDRFSTFNNSKHTFLPCTDVMIQNVYDSIFINVAILYIVWNILNI